MIIAVAAACSGGKRADGPADSALPVPSDTTLRRHSSPKTTTTEHATERLAAED
jgi:hypothetical protein